MALFDAVFEYEVPGLLIDRALFGQRLAIPASNTWVGFPGEDADSHTRNGLRFCNGSVVNGWMEAKDGTKSALIVDSILVGVSIESDLAIDSDDESVFTLLSRAAPVAHSAFIRMTELFRCYRQAHWLDSRASLANRKPLAETLYDEQHRQVEPGVLNLPGAKMRTGRNTLTLDQAETVLAAVGQDQPPPIWDSFLADAEAATDINHSVVLAGIACEIAVKAALVEMANADQQPLIELMLNSFRDYSLAAASLFDQPCQIVIGRSLKDDDRSLWNRVHELFVNRNKIVHKQLAKLGDPHDLQDQVTAAAEAVTWLRRYAPFNDPTVPRR